MGKEKAVDFGSTQTSAADPITLFTSQRCTLPPNYHNQKYEWERLGKLWSSTYEFI